MSIFRRHNPALEACPHCGKTVTRVVQLLDLLREAKLEVAALQRHRLLGPGRAIDGGGKAIRAHQATSAGAGRAQGGTAAGAEPGAQEAPVSGAAQVREGGFVKMAERIEEAKQRRAEKRVLLFMCVTFVLGLLLT